MRSEKRVQAATSAVAIMTISFYVCWLPYAITSTMAIFGLYVASNLSVLAFLFAKLGVIVNPIIYIFFNQEVSVNCASYLFLNAIKILSYDLLKNC